MRTEKEIKEKLIEVESEFICNAEAENYAFKVLSDKEQTLKFQWLREVSEKQMDVLKWVLDE